MRLLIQSDGGSVNWPDAVMSLTGAKTVTGDVLYEALIQPATRNVPEGK